MVVELAGIQTVFTRWFSSSNTGRIMAMVMSVVHCKQKHDVYIGRPSKWGNPFSHKPSMAKYMVATREEAIEKYRIWIQSQPELLSALPELRGKVLGCWCKPKACHGDVLVAMANEEEQ
jgi:hypothetical protein